MAEMVNACTRIGCHSLALLLPPLTLDTYSHIHPKPRLSALTTEHSSPAPNPPLKTTYSSAAASPSSFGPCDRLPRRARRSNAGLAAPVESGPSSQKRRQRLTRSLANRWSDYGELSRIEACLSCALV